jgi:hypothetical protein
MCIEPAAKQSQGAVMANPFVHVELTMTQFENREIVRLETPDNQ